MDVAALGAMIPIVLIIGVAVVLVYLRRYENQERMAMIDKGVDANLFTTKPSHISGALRWSLLLIGVGVGILLGAVLDNMFRMKEIGFFSMIFIFGGAGLGTAYIIEEKRRK